MGQWADQVGLRVAAEMAACARGVVFDGSKPEDLWVWQGKRRAALKQAMAIDLPTAYGVPKARIVDGDLNADASAQTVRIDTSGNTSHEILVQTGRTAAGRPGAVAVELTESINRPDQIEFCKKAAEMGIAGAATSVAAVSDQLDFDTMAQACLTLGKPFAGQAFSAMLGVIDYLEDRFDMDGEPIVLITSARAVPIGLALAALDQRISGIIADFDGAKLGGAPGDATPLFTDQCKHLGPMPLLTLIQCCAPRPMILANFPTETDPWPLAQKAGILPAEKQLTVVRKTFDAAGHPERLETIPPGRVDRNGLALLADFFHKHVVLTEND